MSTVGTDTEVADPATLNDTAVSPLRHAFRITVFVPPEHVDRVLDTILAETPLRFGPYKKSAWWSAVGTEQFEPTEDAEPTVGSIGVTERVPTVRLEFATPRETALLSRVVMALRAAHPWQEPAIFVDQVWVTATELR